MYYKYTYSKTYMYLYGMWGQRHMDMHMDICCLVMPGSNSYIINNVNVNTYAYSKIRGKNKHKHSDSYMHLHTHETSCTQTH